MTFNIGDTVTVLPHTTFVQSTMLHKNGIVTATIPANQLVDTAMYDVLIDNEVYVYFDDELQLVTPVAD